MTKSRIVLALILIGIIAFIEFVILTPTDQLISPKMGINQVNGDDLDGLKLRSLQEAKNTVTLICGTLYGLVALWLFKPLILRLWKSGNKAPVTNLILIGLASTTMVSCMKPYDKPEYVEINNNETAFVFPLEGDTKEQAKFQSKEHLQQAKVAAKRIQITHRWNQTARGESNGEWIPSIRVIKVDRSPVTRNWQAAAGGAQTKGQEKDTAIWVESADSVGFSMGFACTAYVTEEDSATFLYWYPSGSLAIVMDTEIRARIQQGAAEVSAKYPLDILRGKKQEIIDSIRTDVTVFFKERGITITTVGMFGGMTYENTKIQEAIDSVFIAQQEKEKAKAAFEAQEKLNATVTLAAQAQADKKRIEAEGEAKAIDAVQKALQQAGPLYIQREFITRWDGKFPEYYLGGGAGGPSLLLGVPAPTPGKVEHSTEPTPTKN
ncbi:MAG: hypothetical protein RJB39_402 [Candidatus Parcubacteria bacterium]|jgi:hypothetical protein